MEWKKRHTSFLKSRAEIESFTGKTALAVKQDFFARIFAMSLLFNIGLPIIEKVRQEYTEDKE